jgi:nuclear transport factor 2 (NTF2) superfamily protein
VIYLAHLPFDLDSALRTVKWMEDIWNLRDPTILASTNSLDCVWRTGTEFILSRHGVEKHLTRKWNRELSYRLIMELWVSGASRIATRFAFEFHNDRGQWFRGYGNASWEFDTNGLMCRNLSSMNQHPIDHADRKLHWPLGQRPDGYPGLSHFSF